MPRRKRSPGENSCNDKSLTWTPIMDDALVDAFLHQHNIGNRVNGIFTPKAYENIVKELKEKVGNFVEKDKVKNRWKTIKANFAKCFELFKDGISGFAWSPTTKMWSADFALWQNLIEAKPQAAEWMTKPIPYYEKMVILYGDRETEEDAKTVPEVRNTQHSVTQDDFRDPIDDLDLLVVENEVTFESFDSFAGNNLDHKAKPKKAKKSKNDKEVEHIMEALHNVAEAIREGNIVYQKAMQRLPIKEEEVWKLLEELEIEEDLVERAYVYLVERPQKLRALLGCPRERRKNILKMMMFAPSQPPII